MKPLRSLILLVPLSALSLCACRTQELDGGSDTSDSPDASGAGDSPDAAPSGASQDGIENTPFEGVVTDEPFVPTAFELRRETKSARWTLEIHNAGQPCAKERLLGDEIVLVTIRGLGGVAGSWPLDPGDASFQRGLYAVDDGEKPETDTSTQGAVRLDTAPGAPGTTLTGALRVKGATSELGGAFTATVCESP